MANEWRPFIGEYIKAFYDVKLPSGDIVKHCWPNAGYMIAIDGSGREWGRDDGIEIILSPDHPTY